MRVAAAAACETFALSAAATALFDSLNDTRRVRSANFSCAPADSVRTWSSKSFTWPVRRVTIAASREIWSDVWVSALSTSARVTVAFDRSFIAASSSPRRDSIFAASPRPGASASGAGAAATDVTTAGAEAGGGSEATFSAFEPATGAADAGGDTGAETVSVGPAATAGSGVGTAGFATVTDAPTGEGVGDADPAGGDAVACGSLNDRTSWTSSRRVSCTCGRSPATFGSSLGGTVANSADGAITFVG